MAGEIGKLFITLGLEDKDFKASLKGIEAKLKSVGKQMTIVGGVITAALGASVKVFVETGDAINKMADKTGMATEFLSGMKYAAEQSGASFEDVGNAVKGMANFLDTASTGGAAATVTLRKLGLSLSDLQGLSPEETFKVLADAIANVEDPLKRSALAQDVFGRSGTELLPMLSEGSAGFQAYIDQAKKLGLIFSEEDADRATALGDAWADLGNSLKGLAITIGTYLTPVLQPLIEAVTNAIAAFGQWARENPGLSQTMLTFALVLGGLMVTLGPLLMMLPTLAASITLLLSPVGLIVAAIVLLIAGIAALALNWEYVWEGMKNVAATVVNFIIDRFEDFVNSFVDMLNIIPTAINTVIGAFGGEFKVPTIPRLELPSFAGGGIVPGPIGAPVPVLAHGGEVFSGIGGGRGGDINNFYFEGPVNGEQEWIDRIHEGLLRKQQFNASLGWV